MNIILEGLVLYCAVNLILHTKNFKVVCGIIASAGIAIELLNNYM